MWKKFLSRRFLMTAGVLIGKGVGIDVPVEVIGLVGAYVLGESGTDAARVFNKREK